jgi:hypothetical protein
LLRRGAPPAMRLESVSAVADSVSSACGRSWTDLPFGMNVRMRNAWLYHGGGLEPQRAAIGIAD